MEPIEIITPSGHKVYFKPFVTTGQDRQLQRLFVKKLQVDPATQKVDYDASPYYDAEDLAIKFLVEKIILQDGQEITDKDKIFTTIDSWSRQDGKVVYDKIDEICELNKLDKKKLN